MMETRIGDDGSNWPSVGSSSQCRHRYDKDAARGFIQRLLKATGIFPLLLIGFGSRLKGRRSQPFLSIEFLKEKKLSLAKKVIYFIQFSKKWADFSKLRVCPEDGFFFKTTYDCIY